MTMNRPKPSFQALNPNFREVILEKLQRQFFMKLMGFELVSIEAGYIEGRLQIEEKHLQQNYFVHGGVMSTASDIVMGFAAFSLLPEGKGVVTADLRVSYLQPGKGSTLIARGWVDKPGSRLHFCSAEITVINAQGEEMLCNTASSTMCVIDIPAATGKHL
jgi:uncharacterized protein (TIGR00369 family)